MHPKVMHVGGAAHQWPPAEGHCWPGITLAFVVLILVFVPPARLFLLISIPLGLIVAAILYLLSLAQAPSREGGRQQAAAGVVNMAWHPGPRIDKIPVIGVGGAIFTIGTFMIFLIGIPAARWFFLGSIVLGGIIGASLYFWHKRRPVKVDDIDSP